MSNIQSRVVTTLPRVNRCRDLPALLSLVAILGSMPLGAGGCADLSEGPGDGLVDAGVPDAISLDAAIPDGATIPDDASAPAAPVYFLVAELPGEETHNDSYVLPLTRADHIEHARDLVEDGHEATGTYIVVAHMRAGADGINRDLRADGAPAWSWHVSDMIDFADATMEILDGWPSFVEQDVAGWIDNTCFDEGGTEGTLGFWGYTVVEELDEYPTSVP
jgi:hypothetical protein